MFIDSSAFVAILTREPGHERLALAIEQASARFTSGLVMLETIMRVSTILDAAPETVQAAFDRMIEAADIIILPIDAGISRIAVEAFQRFGKGRGHPARLNLADCMSYAAARHLGAPILFAGNDFSRTDIKSAQIL